MFANKRLAALLLTGVMSVAALTGCGAAADKLDGTQTAATVNGETISLGKVSFYCRYQQAESYAYLQSMMGTSAFFDSVYDEESGRTVGEEMVSGSAADLEKMVIIRQHAAEYDVALTDEENAAIDAAAQAYMDKNGEDVHNRVGASKEDVVSYLEDATIQSKMMNALTADVEVEPTDEECEQSTVSIVRLAVEDVEDEAALQVDMEAAYNAILAADDPEADMLTIAQEVNEDFTGYSGAYTKADPTDTSLDANIVEAVKDLKDGEICKDFISDEEGTYLMIVRKDKDVDPDRTETRRNEIIRSAKSDAYDEIVNAWVEESETSENADVLAQIKMTDSVIFTVPYEDESSVE
ncbi:MAG: hypothetical protein Q4B73_09485 [Lachnospiraceae bacterium]|nr:hypothetical protein [Lachnospiraceae bacterium]